MTFCPLGKNHRDLITQKPIRYLCFIAVQAPEFEMSALGRESNMFLIITRTILLARHLSKYPRSNTFCDHHPQRCATTISGLPVQDLANLLQKSSWNYWFLNEIQVTA
jgi:hypothetical protein